MEFREITPIRLYESVIEQIMNLIKNNKLKPGDKLPPERELAGRLSISRGSLREAFRVLESRGIIKSKPGGGRYIREIRKNGHNNTENIILSLEKSSILELLEAREIFEVKIVKLTAQKATAEDIELIEEALNKMNKEEELKDDKKTESDTCLRQYNKITLGFIKRDPRKDPANSRKARETMARTPGNITGHQGT
jgi:GntR family transcriptional repressor for pyruvate dehydrogenase complex